MPVRRDGDLAELHLAGTCLTVYRNAVHFLAEHPDRAVGAHEVQVRVAAPAWYVARVVGQALHGVTRGRRPEVTVDLELDGLDERRAVGRAGQRPHELGGHGLHDGPGGSGTQPDIDDRGLAPGRAGQDLDLPQPCSRREGGDRRALQPAVGVLPQVVYQGRDEITGFDGDEHRVGHEQRVRLRVEVQVPWRVV